MERIVKKAGTQIRPFFFFNNGTDNQFSDRDQKNIYTELMLRKVCFKKLDEFSNFKVIRIRFFPEEGRKPYQFLFRNLYPCLSATKTKNFFFAKNKDFIVINIPPLAQEVVVEVDGDLAQEVFELHIEYFLV